MVIARLKNGTLTTKGELIENSVKTSFKPNGDLEVNELIEHEGGVSFGGNTLKIKEFIEGVDM